MNESLFAITLALFSVANGFSQATATSYKTSGKSPGLQISEAETPNLVRGYNRFFTKPTPKISNNPYAPSPLVGEAYRKMLAAQPPVIDEPVKKTSNVGRSDQNNLPGSANAGKYFDPSSLQLRPLPDPPRLLMKGFTTGNLLVDSFIVESSHRYTIDPLLIYAQMHQESSFKQKAKSHKGASGLMQLMPATARRLGVTDIYDPKQNIDGGVKYMRMLLNMFSGNVNLALAGYNAGEGAVMKYGYQIPPYRETQDYVKRISSKYSRISGSTLHQSISPAEVKPPVYAKSVEQTVSPAPGGWETGIEMMQRYARSTNVNQN